MGTIKKTNTKDIKMATVETNGNGHADTNGYDDFIADQEKGDDVEDQEPDSPKYRK